MRGVGGVDGAIGMRRLSTSRQLTIRRQICGPSQGQGGPNRSNYINFDDDVILLSMNNQLLINSGSPIPRHFIN